MASIQEDADLLSALSAVAATRLHRSAGGTVCAPMPPPSDSYGIFADAGVRCAAAVRSTCPLVVCVGNDASSEFVSDALLAVGARVAHARADAEAAELVAAASAVLVSADVDAPGLTQRASAVIEAARAAHKPWVLHSAGCGASEYRCVDRPLSSIKTGGSAAPIAGSGLARLRRAATTTPFALQDSAVRTVCAPATVCGMRNGR